MLYHYTDRDSATDIISDGLLKSHPVIVMDALIGSKAIHLEPAVWLTTAEICDTVLVKLQVAGWPLEKPGMIWRFGCKEDEIEAVDLPDWAFPKHYDSQIFRFMLLTAHLVGENWQDWRLSNDSISKEKWSVVQSFIGGQWVNQTFV